jgi:PAS domain S-box-containing protein
MPKGRKLKPTDDVRRPRRKDGRLRSKEPVWLARIPQENSDPVFRVSADHVLLYSNPAAEELRCVWGCRLGQKVPTAIRAIISAALADGAVVRQEVAFASHTYGLTVAPSVADGYVNVYARDVTDCRRAEEALRQAERRFQAIFDNTSDGIFLLDLETRNFTMCNNACSQMLGYTQDEFIDLSIPDLHLQADLPLIQAQIDEFLEGRRGTRHDIRFKRKDGSIVFTDLSPNLLLLDGKRYIVVALKDVTERKRAEEALQSERDQARQYLRVAGVMMVALDAEGRITLINEKGCEILGYRQEEILGRDWFDFCVPQEIRAEITGVFRRLLAGDIAPVEYYANVLLRKDGQQRLVAFHNTVLRDPSSRIVGVLFSGEDITERRRIEEALTASERKYRSLVENIPDVTWTTDRQGHTLFISPNVRNVYGYSAEEICAGGDTWLGNVHPDERPRIEKAFDDLFTRKKPFDVEYRIRRKDGNWIWLHDRSVSSYEKEGQQYADGVFSDITERKRMEEELRRHTEHLEELIEARTRELQESEQRYRSLAENAPDIIQRFDRELRHLYVNPAFGRATGLSPRAVIGKTDRELRLPKDLIPFWEQAAQTVFRTGESQILVFEMPTPKGPRHYEARLVPEFAPDGAVEYLLAITRDITERVQAEESLRFTQFAVDHTADAAFWMTAEGRFFYVNEAACRALGYSREELLQMTVYDIDPAFTETMWRESWRGLKEAKSIVLETVHRARDGRVYPVEIRANYLEFGGREYDCAFARDITERKRAEEALRRLNERLELQVAERTEDLRHTVDRLQQLTLELSQAEDRERKRIADILHDDVQQTLAAAKFHLNLLGRETRSAEESREIVEQVKQMLKDAIEKSRRLSHELSPALYQVDLTAILEWLARHMQQKHGLTVRVEAHGPIDFPSEPLKAFLHKVAQELLFNVVKHAGVREARIRVRRLGPRLYLSVVDRGRGFNPQRLEMAAGFGLLGIRERIQLLGGRMKIKSTPGTGTTLLIALPYEAPSQTTGPAWDGDGQVRSDMPA